LGAGLFHRYQSDEVFSAEHFIDDRSHSMNVLVANLYKN